MSIDGRFKNYFENYRAKQHTREGAGGMKLISCTTTVTKIKTGTPSEKGEASLQPTQKFNLFAQIR